MRVYRSQIIHEFCYSMAAAGIKILTIFGTIFLLATTILTIWKETEITEICLKSLKLSHHLENKQKKGSKTLNYLNYVPSIDIIRRPVRNSLTAYHGKPTKNYMAKESLPFYNYTRYTDRNITLFVSSPPSSGIITILEVFYALKNNLNTTVIPLVDNSVIGTGKPSTIIQHIHKAIRTASPPALIHTHALYALTPPNLARDLVSISIVREPIQRAMSLYYYTRANSSPKETEEVRKWRASLSNLRMESYDDCVKFNRSECVSPRASSRLIRQFCGYDKQCEANDRWALEQAKKNAEHFLAIGTMDDLQTYCQVLERRIPSMFGGGGAMYNTLIENRKISKVDKYVKNNAEDITIEKMKIIMALDIELYEWIRDRFEKTQEIVGMKI